MPARSTRPWTRLSVAVFVLAAVALPAVALPAVAAAPGDVASQKLLARPLFDAAFISHVDGSAPDLLTLDAAEPSSGQAHVAVLRRDATGWSQLTEATIPITESVTGINQPWLVSLDAGRFMVLATAPDAQLLYVVPLIVDTSGDRRSVTSTETATILGNVANAGPADVDGDGAKDLVVSTWGDGDGNGRCVDTTIHILGQDEAGWQRSDHVIKLKGADAVRLTGAAFGKFDARPGDDMLAHVYDTCRPSDDGLEPHHLVAISLLDGSIVKDLPSTNADSQNIVPSAPRVLDVDGDGRDEAVVRGASGLAVIDPSDGWKILVLDVGDIQLLGERSGSPATGGAIVSWVAPLEGTDASIRTARIQRSGRSLAAVKAAPVPFPGIGANTLFWVLDRLRYDYDLSGSTSVTSTDLDRDGCPELILPYLTADCLGTGSVRSGPAWFNVRPIAVVGPAADQRLLVAEGVDWYPSQEGPYPPTPGVATTVTWRSGWSQPFFLAEVDLPSGSGGAPVSAYVPPPVVDTLADKDGAIDLQGPAGTRLLLRVIPIRTDAPGTIGAMSIDRFMRGEQVDAEVVLSRRLPIDPDVGSSRSTFQFSIADETSPGYGTGAERWTLSTIVLDPLGEPSEVTQAIIVSDQVAPTLTLDAAPFVSPPWPFEAQIHGKAEPGSTVRLGDRPSVVVGASGAFEIPTQLAPWPQTLEAKAVDASGNQTPASVSIMGGVDVRMMPWPQIAAVAIIIAVALSSLRGTRRVRSIAPVAVASDDGGDYVIEELDPGSTFRRD